MCMHKIIQQCCFSNYTVHTHYKITKEKNLVLIIFLKINKELDLHSKAQLILPTLVSEIFSVDGVNHMKVKMSLNQDILQRGMCKLYLGKKIHAQICKSYSNYAH